MHPVEVMLQYGVVAAALAGAWVAFRKSPAERSKMGAETAAVAVGAQQKIIDDLQSELERAQEYAQRLKKEWTEEVAKIRSDHQEQKQDLRTEVNELREENERLQSRIYGIEHKLGPEGEP